MERQFTSGSRQAPDPFDQFLEEHNFYRKHTARDASCLFRVISEQMYDTQLHHLAIREKCVTYMRKHRKYFDFHVDRDFDDYLNDMSKPKTYGTLLELQAASYMFERNVFLFHPFNLGNYFNEYRSNYVEVFRVFYTPERHFDSVFTSDYIQEAAICQSICYEILYKDLFKLPDVSFAVEQMLHGPTFENMDYRTETNEEGYTTRFHLSDGRSFELDLPHNTNCILENYKLCHFHHINFPRYSDDLQRELKSANYEDYDKNSLIIQRTAESFLPNKYVSCVRQLLQEGITPFPYKVAKALDPNMYRNIEFDSWNEVRKEMKLQNWYNGDANFKLIRYSTRRVRKIFQVGAKCHVKLRKSEQDLYTCHIQEIALDKGQCIVFVEQLGEKRLVPYENLTPLPPDQFKPWTVPYRLQRHMQKYSSVRFTRQYNYRLKFNATTEHHHHHEFACESSIDNDSCSNNYISDDPKMLMRPQQNHQHCTTAASYFKLKQYTHLEDFRAHVEYCTMPLTVAHTNREVEVSKTTSESGGGGGNQSRMPDSSDNSRTPSRSSTSMGIHRNNAEGTQNKVHSNNNNVEEHLAVPQPLFVPHMDSYDVDHYNPNGATMYMPEMQGFYPMYPYSTPPGLVDDYYGYCGFDGVLSPGAAIVPPVNNMNGIYYLCNNTLAPPGNYINSPNPYFVPPPPPLHSVGVGQPSPSMLPLTNTPNPPYYPPPPFTNASNNIQSNQGCAPPLNLHSFGNSTPPCSAQRSGSNTPTNTQCIGYINYEAKKSLKSNGIDLPNDMATVRYFYNIGLEYYNNQIHHTTEVKPNDDHDILTNDLQNNKNYENGNQNLNTKSDANNTKLNATPNDASHATESNQINKHNNANVNSSANCGGGDNNKNNNLQRRYSSRYFSGKDRQIPQRNNTNQNLQSSGHQHQYHQNNQRSYNNSNNTKYPNNNYNVANNNTQATTRNTQQQTNQQHILHPPPQQPLNSPHLLTEPSRQISPNSEPSKRANVAELRNCNTPTTANNSNIGVENANNSDQVNDGIAATIGNNGQLSVPMQSATGGVYIPIQLTAVPPPPPQPYGIFGAHPTASGAHHTPGVGMHSNYMAVPPPQMITHCGLSQTQQNSGLDNMDNVGNSEITTNSGAVMTMPAPRMPIQCPNYPPPIPYYYSPTGVNPMVGSAGGAVASFSQQVSPSTPSNQTPFVSPHPSMGTQTYYCLQPPPLPPPQQQLTPQMVQQPLPISANRMQASNSLPYDNNNGPPRNDLVQQNND